MRDNTHASSTTASFNRHSRPSSRPCSTNKLLAPAPVVVRGRASGRLTDKNNNRLELVPGDPRPISDCRAWPAPSVEGMPTALGDIYDKVRKSGLPNCVGAQIQLPSALNIEAWTHYLTTVHKDEELLACLKYGFPMGYGGPPQTPTEFLTMLVQCSMQALWMTS